MGFEGRPEELVCRDKTKCARNSGIMSPFKKVAYNAG